MLSSPGAFWVENTFEDSMRGLTVLYSVIVHTMLANGCVGGIVLSIWLRTPCREKKSKNCKFRDRDEKQVNRDKYFGMDYFSLSASQKNSSAGSFPGSASGLYSPNALLAPPQYEAAAADGTNASGAFVDIPDGNPLRAKGYSVLVVRSASIRDALGASLSLPHGFLCDGATYFPDVGSAWAWHDYCYAKQYNKQESDDLLEDIWSAEGYWLSARIAGAAFESRIGTRTTDDAYNRHHGKPIPIMNLRRTGLGYEWQIQIGNEDFSVPVRLRQKNVFCGLVKKVPGTNRL
jgi:hypothetical protein